VYGIFSTAGLHQADLIYTAFLHQSFDENSILEGILEDLILPAVKRKELVMRSKGLVSLGLCGLIEKVHPFLSYIFEKHLILNFSNQKNIALKSFQLFLSQIQTAPEDLKLKVLQIVFDMLMVYEKEFFGRSEDIVSLAYLYFLWVPALMLLVGEASQHVSPADFGKRRIPSYPGIAMYWNIEVTPLFSRDRYPCKAQGIQFDRFADSSCWEIGPNQLGPHLCITSYGREFGVETVSLVLLPRLLLFVREQSKEDAISKLSCYLYVENIV
jgi:hypothetical protein